MAISLGPSGLNINGTIIDGPEDLGAGTGSGEVGTYAPGYNKAGNKQRGQTVSGGQIETCNLDGQFDSQYANGAVFSGTWRLMNGTPDNSTALFVRVS